jgi:hypothetical protein
MFRWGRRNRQGRGCCVVVPIGRLISLTMSLLFFGLAVAQLL